MAVKDGGRRQLGIEPNKTTLLTHYPAFPPPSTEALPRLPAPPPGRLGCTNSPEGGRGPPEAHQSRSHFKDLHEIDQMLSAYP